MKIFKISQKTNTINAYINAIVVAQNEEDARKMNPAPFGNVYYDFDKKKEFIDWANTVDEVQVEYLGEAKKGLKNGSILGFLDTL